ncbi:MAG TPA: OB-fold nucleic acid binding domain-containing protein, partial [Chryseosolibacter sp.]|nr:OB-fold nucleic acid binding domain-containing protein [Chryseosolibacter sp.]
LVYVSSWIKCYYPDLFACALLNSMPMGFYQPAQIIIDARKHGVEVRPVDVNYSAWDNTLEERSGKYYALRLGFRQIRGIREEDMNMLIRQRKKNFRSVQELRAAGIPDSALEKLADADTFRSIGLDRRKALWEVSTRERPHTLYAEQAAKNQGEEDIVLPEMKLSEHVVHDYATTSLSLKAHPVSFVREDLLRLGIVSAADLEKSKDGDLVKVAGLILVRQRPGTASGICFITLEDETGTANLVVFQQLFDKYRKEIIQSRLLMVEGQLQKEGEVIHVVVRRCFNYSRLLRKLTAFEDEDPAISTFARADERSGPSRDARIKKETGDDLVQGKIFPEGRNFR